MRKGRRVADAQRRLFPPGAATGAMTAHQQTVWQAVKESEGGITPTEAGRRIHASTGAHTEDVSCQFCRSTGRAVLDNLRDRQLVKRRRTGIYQVARKPERADQWPVGF